MEHMSEKEFKTQSNIEIIEGLMKANNGYITSKIISDLGIHRMYISIMLKNKKIEKLGSGVYIDISKMSDDYYTFSLVNKIAIFSHMTALYFHGLSIKAPANIYDITVPANYHNQKITKHNIFYAPKEIYNLGLTEITTPQGNKVKCYDVERCICDIVKYQKRLDLEHVKYSIKEYLKSKNKNLAKLTSYAEKIGIKDEVITFISLLY